MNIKKLFALLAGVSLVAQTVVPSAGVFGATYSQELQDAYDWAYSKGVTTMSSIDNANMYGAITRAQMAKMLSVYATEVLGATPDTAAACNFTDIDSVKGDLHDYIIQSCQLGLMGQGITAFRPYSTITRAEFGTALSRTLWGDKYNGGTPYYAKHLDALKSAGIMTQIDNPEGRDEVRGYVMIMLQRSAEGGAGVDCDDPVVALACLDPELDAYKECPAACRDNGEEDNNKDEDEVVRSGDLDVTVAGNSDGKLFIGRPSELDTITIKTSEEVTVSKVILKREGYSSKENIKSVWLEDEKGTVITNKTTGLDSKGQAKLTLKKDYKVVDGDLVATIVVETADATAGAYKKTEAGATVGFSVVEVESTAKDTNISGKANTYTAIAFDGSKISFSTKPTTKTYNYVAGDLYEVAKFKVNTPDDSAIILRGFTFKNVSAGTQLDLKKFFDKAEVTIAGEKVKDLDASVNKDNELVVSFKDFEVAAKEKAEVIVKVSLTEDFDTFGSSIEYNLSDYAAVDADVEARVSATTPTPYGPMTAYTFKGGKVKLTNEKLGNVDAAQNSEDILVAKGSIEVPETMKGTFVIQAKGKAAGAIKQLTFTVNRDDTDADPVLVSYDGGKTAAVAAWSSTAGAYAAGNYVEHNKAIYKANATTTAGTWKDTEWDLVDSIYSFTFTNVEIEKSGTVKFTADIYDEASWNGQSVEFDTFKAAVFSTLAYDESSKEVVKNGVVQALGDVSGSVSFSKVTIQAAKASMSNNLTKDVEFMNKSTSREIVFDGTYTAKKGDIKLNEFALSYASATDVYGTTDKVTFYVYVDDMDTVANDADAKYDNVNKKYVATNTFDNVLVENGKTVRVKVEAEVEAEHPTLAKAVALGKYEFKVWGEDEHGNTPSGEGKANTTAMKVVENGSVNVSTSAVKQTIIRKANDAVAAEFIVKPANDASSVTLEEIQFNIAGLATAPTSSDARITLKVDNIEEDDYTVSGAGPYTLTYSMNKEVKSEGVVVKVTIDNENDQIGLVTLDELVINKKAQTKTFSKSYVEAAVWVKSQTDNKGTTQYVLGVDKDSDVSVRNFTMYYNNGSAQTEVLNKEFSDGDKMSINGRAGKVDNIYGVSYEYTNGNTWTQASAGVPAVAAVYSFTPDTTQGVTFKNVATADVVLATATTIDDQVTALNSAAGALYTAVKNGTKIELTAKTAGAIATDPTCTAADLSAVTITEDTAGDDGTPATYTCTASDGTTVTAGSKDACEWSAIKIKKAATPDLPAGGIELPDYFKVGENEDDLKIFNVAS